MIAAPPSPRRLAEHTLIVAMAAAGPLAHVAASPVYSSGDEAAHVDYALQVWQGRLPVFEDGLVLENTVGMRPAVQWTAQHPPLFYLLLAPVVGPLANGGQVELAGLAARLVVVLLAVALAYAVRGLTLALCHGDRRIALAGVAILSLSLWYVRLGGSVYNDILAALTAVLAFWAYARLVQGGRSWGLVAAFALVLAASSLVRLASVPLAGLLAVALVLVAAFGRSERRGRLLVAAAAGTTGMALASGWFYARNLALTGSVTGGHPEWAMANIDRTRIPLGEVVRDPEIWARLAEQYFSNRLGFAPGLVGNAVLFLLPALVGAILFLRRERGASARSAPVVIATVAAASVGVTMMQVLYVTSTGGANGRYLFTITALVAPFLAIALLTAGRRAWPLAAWIVVQTAVVGSELSATIAAERRGPQADVHPSVAWTAFGVLVAACVLAIVLLARSRGEAERTAWRLAS